MALTLDVTKAIRKLTEIAMFVPVTTTPFSTTVAVQNTQGASTISVAATTSATSADPVALYGPGGTELITIGTPAANMPIANQKLHLIHPVGTQVIEMVKISLGKIAKGSAKMTGSRPVNPFYADNEDGVAGYLEGNEEYGAAFGLYELSGEAMARLFGKTPVIVGAGSSSDPEQGFLGDPNAPAPPSLICLRATGLLHGGRTFQVDFLDARMEPQIDTPLDGRDAVPSFLTNVRCKQIAIRSWV